MSSGNGVVLSLNQVLRDALINAGRAMSTLTGAGFDTHGVSFTEHDLWDLPALFASPAEAVAASFFEVQGDLRGFLLLLVPGSDLPELMSLLLGAEGYDADLVDSAVGELGNIVGTAFLNHLADSYHLFAAPTPPQVVRDMVGALLNTLAAGLAAAGEPMPFIVRARFDGGHAVSDVSTYLVWLPRAGILDRLMVLP